MSKYPVRDSVNTAVLFLNTCRAAVASDQENITARMRELFEDLPPDDMAHKGFELVRNAMAEVENGR